MYKLLVSVFLLCLLKDAKSRSCFREPLMLAQKCCSEVPYSVIGYSPCSYETPRAYISSCYDTCERYSPCGCYKDYSSPCGCYKDYSSPCGCYKDYSSPCGCYKDYSSPCGCNRESYETDIRACGCFRDIPCSGYEASPCCGSCFRDASNVCSSCEKKGKKDCCCEQLKCCMGFPEVEYPVATIEMKPYYGCGCGC